MGFFKEAVERLRAAMHRLLGSEPSEAGCSALDDVLSEHADALIRGGGDRQYYLRRWPEETDLLTLLPLAEKAHAALRPVIPAASFRNRLYQDLMGQAGCPRGAPSLWQERRKEIIIGATVTSVLLSAAGVLTYIILQRPPHRRSQAHGGGAGGGPSLG